MTAHASSRHGRIVDSSFRPHPLMQGAHAQTIAPALLRPRPGLPLRHERLELPDGDFVDLGWAGKPGKDSPIAILIHGLGGGFESKYVLGLGWRLVAAGWRVCALQQRGAGLEPNRLAHAYNHGDTAPLRHLWRHLREREPQAYIATVGWSLGGNVLLKALGEEGRHAPVDSACAVSVPFRLHECAEHLRRGFARVYQGRLLGVCKNVVQRKHAQLPLMAPIDLDKALAARDFFEFDNAFTAPANGYTDAADYYARAACGQYLSQIRRPTLILHAIDDPFMLPAIVPAANTLAPDVTLELSAQGGHVGFVSAGPLGLPHAWSESHLCRHLVAAHATDRGSNEVEIAAQSA
ncbi:MAG: hydrolase [Panacagrimonas sp.]